MTDEANLAYRAARRDFIAAVTAAGADAIGRVHPQRGPDGKPLFCDSAALGARTATRGMLLVGGPLTQILQTDLKLSDGARLVLVHAPDPYAAAWDRPGSPAGWPVQTLATIAGEELARVKTLTVLDMAGLSDIKPALTAILPGAALHFPKAPTDIKGLLAAIAALGGSGL